MRERCCCARRDCSVESEVDSESDIVSSPEISRRRVDRSVWSALPLIEVTAFWKKDSEGASDIFRSRARSRARLTSSISREAASPAALRATVVSVTGLGLVKKFCQGEDTDAKPERRAMTEMPMTPIFSDVVSSIL